MRLTALVLSAVIANAACVPITADRILARDLAAANPVFASPTPDRVISFAPMPGTQRTFSAHELDMIAKRLAIVASSRFAPICVERWVERLEPEQMRIAMAAVLGVDKDQVEILDFSRYSVPPGRVEFPR